MKHILFAVGLTLIWATSSFAQEDYKVKNLNTHYENSDFYEVVKLPEKVKFAKQPKNIILLIGDGMGVAQIFSAVTANRGYLNITQMPYVGFSQTQSADQYITDSAAGGTALAAGQRTYNGGIGVNTDTVPIPSILEISEKNGLATGLVSTSAITHATPASFIAHQPSRNMYEAIATDFLKTDIDVFIGGGYQFFAERTDDNRNLVNELQNKGYKVVKSIEEADAISSGRLAVLTAEAHNKSYPERGELLPEATTKAIEVLNNNSKKGFFLMVEGSMIDWGGHANNTSYVIKETLDFDRAVGLALEFAATNKETLVIVTADHETGGMTIEGGSIEKGEVTADFTSDGHTAVMVPVFAYGAGADNFKGVYKNTDIFEKMKAAFGF